jgi:hypothetical protein
VQSCRARVRGRPAPSNATRLEGWDLGRLPAPRASQAPKLEAITGTLESMSVRFVTGEVGKGKILVNAWLPCGQVSNVEDLLTFSKPVVCRVVVPFTPRE